MHSVHMMAVCRILNVQSLFREEANVRDEHFAGSQRRYFNGVSDHCSVFDG